MGGELGGRNKGDAAVAQTNAGREEGEGYVQTGWVVVDRPVAGQRQLGGVVYAAAQRGSCELGFGPERVPRMGAGQCGRRRGNDPVKDVTQRETRAERRASVSPAAPGGPKLVAMPSDYSLRELAPSSQAKSQSATGGSDNETKSSDLCVEMRVAAQRAGARTVGRSAGCGGTRVGSKSYAALQGASADDNLCVCRGVKWSCVLGNDEWRDALVLTQAS